MNYYPYYDPIILTDAIYETFGGDIDSSTPAQRQYAYREAEWALSSELNTFLLPTIVTGSYRYHPYRTGLLLDHSYVTDVFVVRFIDTQESVYWSQTGTANIYVSVRNDERGVLDVDYLIGSCRCSTATNPYPYEIQIMYEAGFPSGTSYQPAVLMALTTLAEIDLNEMLGYGNESPGDVGVQSFSNQQYSERRVALLRTSFGTSAKANYALRKIERLKRRKYVGL